MGLLWLTCSFGLFLALLSLPVVRGDSHGDDPPKLILISMDSLFYSLIESLPANKRTHYDYFKTHGVFAKSIMNVWPTSTYPDHYTLITGLYPESHGIVANRFYATDLGEYFNYGLAAHNYESKWYDTGAEPIYVTNNKAGGNRKSGTVLFPTGMAEVKGVKPDRWIQDDGTYPPWFDDYEFPYLRMPYENRVDTMLDWFLDADNPINLGLLYFPEPDELCHLKGPSSVDVKNEVGGPLNDALGYLIDQLEKRGLKNTTNVLLTADHGHTDVKMDKIVLMDDYLDRKSYNYDRTYKQYIVVGLWPTEGMEEEVIANMSRCPDVEVYKKADMPMYSQSVRIAPVIIKAKDGIVIRKTKQEADDWPYVGMHGYDPVEVPAMKPVFMAMGPGFKKGVSDAREFKSVDIYPMMCHLLGITPAPNNGSLDNVKHILEMDDEGDNGARGMTATAALLVAGLVTSFLFSA